MDGYELIPTTPGVDDYLRLRIAAGLSPKTREQAEIGLPNSWYGVTVVHDGAAVGMGRVIGDGGTAFQIVDIALDFGPTEYFSLILLGLVSASTRSATRTRSMTDTSSS